MVVTQVNMFVDCGLHFDQLPELFDQPMIHLTNHHFGNHINEIPEVASKNTLPAHVTLRILFLPMLPSELVVVWGFCTVGLFTCARF